VHVNFEVLIFWHIGVLSVVVIGYVVDLYSLAFSIMVKRLILYIVVCPLSFLFLVIVLSVLRFTPSNYPFGIVDLRLLITPLVSSNLSYTLDIVIHMR